MKRLLLILPLAACSPPALCDRDAQPYDKVETQEDQCHETRPVQIKPYSSDNDRPSARPEHPDNPPHVRDIPSRDKHTGWDNKHHSVKDKKKKHKEKKNKHKKGKKK